MPDCGNRFFHSGPAFFAHTVPKPVCRTGSRSFGYPLAVIMPRRGNAFYNFLIRAVHAGIICIAVLRAGRLFCQQFAKAVAACLHIIGGIPLAANGAYMLCVTLLGAGRVYNFGNIVIMAVAVMLPHCSKRHIPSDRHAVRISIPPEECISGFYGQRRLYYGFVRKSICIEWRAVRIEECHCIIAQRLLYNGVSRDILRRSCRNAISNAVAVQIPTDHDIIELLIRGNLIIRLPHNLRSEIIATVQNISVDIVESCIYPIIPIVNGIAIIPVRIIFVPHDVEFIVLDIDCYTLKIFEHIGAFDLHSFFKHNRF